MHRCLSKATWLRRGPASRKTKSREAGEKGVLGSGNLWSDSYQRILSPLPPTHSLPRCQGRWKPQKKGVRRGTPVSPTARPVITERIVPGLAWPLTLLANHCPFLGLSFPMRNMRGLDWIVLNDLSGFVGKSRGSGVRHVILQQRKLERWGLCGGKRCGGFRATCSWVPSLALPLISSLTLGELLTSLRLGFCAERVVCPPPSGRGYNEIWQGKPRTQA